MSLLHKELQIGSLCQVHVELARGATLFPSYFFHHTLNVPLLFGWGHRAWPCRGCSDASCAALRSGSSATLLPALSGNLPVWVAKCAHYARYYHIAALGEVAKCSGVWYAVKLPMYPGMGVRICLCLHLGEIRSKIKISCGFELPTFLYCHCYCDERSRSKNTRIYPVCAWKHVFMQDEVEGSSVSLPLSGLVCASDGRRGKQEEKNEKTRSLFLWSPVSMCVCDVWSTWRDSVPAACMKPQLSEIRLEMLPAKEAAAAPPSQWATKGGADFQIFNPRASFDCLPARRVKDLTSGLPVALKKKQPYRS